MQRHHFADKGLSSQDYGFSSRHVWMWELDCKAERQRMDAFELWCWRRLLSPLDSKEVQPVNRRGNQPWIFIGRTETEAPILWLSDVKSQVSGKDPDAGKDWAQEEKGTTEDEMVGWHHRLIDMSLGRLRELVMEREALQAAVHGVTKSRTWLSDWTKLLDHCKSKRVPENYLLLLYWLCQSLWLCGSQQSQENSSRDGNTRPPNLPLETAVCRSGSNS